MLLAKIIKISQCLSKLQLVNISAFLRQCISVHVSDIKRQSTVARLFQTGLMTSILNHWRV